MVLVSLSTPLVLPPMYVTQTLLNYVVVPIKLASIALDLLPVVILVKLAAVEFVETRSLAAFAGTEKLFYTTLNCRNSTQKCCGNLFNNICNAGQTCCGNAYAPNICCNTTTEFCSHGACVPRNGTTTSTSTTGTTTTTTGATTGTTTTGGSVIRSVSVENRGDLFKVVSTAM